MQQDEQGFLELVDVDDPEELEVLDLAMHRHMS